MKSIQQLIDEKTANFQQLLNTRQNLIGQLEDINQTLLELKGHIEGLKAASQASQDESPTGDVETNNG